MKIIGQVDNDNLIVNISREEIANIRGLSSIYDLNNSCRNGDEINVCDIFYNAVKTLKAYKNFKSLLKDFEAQAKFLNKLLNTNKLKK